MTVLKYATGLFAIFLITFFPIIVRSEDICEESADRVESYLTSYVDKVAAGGVIEDTGLKKLISSLAREPDVYEVCVTAYIKHIVPGGESYFVTVENGQIRSILDRKEKLFLSEGDTVRVSARVTVPSLFSKITGRYDSQTEREAREFSCGRRIGHIRTDTVVA